MSERGSFREVHIYELLWMPILIFFGGTTSKILSMDSIIGRIAMADGRWTTNKSRFVWVVIVFVV